MKQFDLDDEEQFLSDRNADLENANFLYTKFQDDFEHPSKTFEFWLWITCIESFTDIERTIKSTEFKANTKQMNFVKQKEETISVNTL